MSVSVESNGPQTGLDGTGNNKPLWTAVGLLGTAVLALGAALVYVQSHPGESRAVGSPSVMTQALPGPVDQPVLAQDEVGKPVVAPVKKAPPAARPVAQKHDKPVQPAPGAANSQAAPVVIAAIPAVAVQPPVPVKPACANCATVEAATPIQRESAGSGVGAVAGGVLGAVVGNQVGAGSGKTAATILGALGGGWAGNEVEKRMKKVTVYDVRVRMEDGATRSFELATAVAAGAKVTVEGNALRLADGSLAGPLLVKPAPQIQGNSPNNPNSPIQTGG